MHREPVAPKVHAREDLPVDQREREGIRLLDLQGRLTIGDSEASLRGAIIALVDAGIVSIILNLADVMEIDEDGAGALVFCYAEIAKSGGALKLLNLPRHLSLMILTKLDAVFEVFSEEEDAINSFFRSRAINHYDILDWVEEQEERLPAASQADPGAGN